MSVKEIEAECAIMYARKALATNFSKNNDGVMVAGIIDNGGTKEGFVETKYGFIPVK